MKIVDVKATAVNVPAEFSSCGKTKKGTLGICVVEVTTDDGLVGVGMTAITEEEVVAFTINNIIAPAINGDDPLCTDRVWNKLYWLLTPRGQSGYACHAIAAVDIALWDIKGQALRQPIWKLLGGARDKVITYATIGFDFFDNDQLVEVAQTWQAEGFNKFKMVVGHNALKRRDEPRPVLEAVRNDIRRVQTLREAIGEEAEIFIDANCNLDPYHAAWLAERVEEYNISFFEEPLIGNDPQQLNQLRSRTRIPLAGGQNEGQSSKFKQLLLNDSLDILQPNVAISGGYTQCVKIAGMAEAFNTGIDNGGAWPFHNLHLHAGVRNGGMVEYHIFAVKCLEQIFNGLPKPESGFLRAPNEPGLGFTLNQDALKELAKMPTSRGMGK